MKFLLIIALLQSIAFAQEVNMKVIAAVKSANYDLGIGSKIEFKIQNKNVSGVFLGRMVSENGKALEYLLLDEAQTRIYLVNPENLTTDSRKNRTQAIMSPIDQAGETCAAYAFFHFWEQMYHVGFKGSAALQSTMSNERERLKLMEENISRYYVSQRDTIPSIMKSYGTRFGFKCTPMVFDNSAAAIDYVFERTSQGKPVLMDFNIGATDMLKSTYELVDYETGEKKDTRLWIPRKVGERTNSGHAIVAAAAFVSKGRKKILVLDSNWTEPRVWDLEKYLGGNTAIKEMGFNSCN